MEPIQGWLFAYRHILKSLVWTVHVFQVPHSTVWVGVFLTTIKRT